MTRKSVIGASIALLVTSAAIFAGPAIAAPAPKDVLTHYTVLAEAKFQDALSTAKALDAAIDALIAKPSDETLKAARAAWIAARAWGLFFQQLDPTISEALAVMSRAFALLRWARV